MSYTKTEWKAREGVNLDRFLKTEETNEYVFLENVPDSITVPGTPFDIDNMNKIEQGIFDAHKAINEADTEVTEGSSNLIRSGAVFSSLSGKAATFIIGTELSGHKKSEVDYLCTGVNDDIVINQAIQNVPYGGDIIIREGQYNINKTILLNKTVRLIGAGFPLLNVNISPIITHDNELGAITITAAWCSVHNLSIEGTSFYGIFVNGGHAATIERNSIKLTGNGHTVFAGAIRMSDSHHTKVLRNYIHHESVNIYFGILLYYGCWLSRISQNHVANVNDSVSHGIQIEWDCNMNIISQNTIGNRALNSGTISSGINLFAGNAPCNANQIINNDISSTNNPSTPSNAYALVDVGANSQNIITGNRLIGTTDNGGSAFSFDLVSPAPIPGSPVSAGMYKDRSVAGFNLV